jgi:hypothetical protein
MTTLPRGILPSTYRTGTPAGVIARTASFGPLGTTPGHGWEFPHRRDFLLADLVVRDGSGPVDEFQPYRPA